MDQEAQYPEEFTGEASGAPLPEEAYDDVPFEPMAPPAESTFGRYLRENRMLNSLLIALLVTVTFFAIVWNLIVFMAGGGDGETDFSDAGQAPVQQKQQKQQKVKLMKRQ